MPTTRTVLLGAALPVALAAGAFAPASAETTLPTTGTDPVLTGSLDPVAADANDALQFSSDLSGEWKGGGDVLAKIEQERPYRVRCDFTVDASDVRFDLDGECGALFLKRPIRTVLEREGDAVTGTYDAELRTGTAALEGEARDGAIELDVDWGGEVNGDTEARMRIVREGEALRVLTIDRDPATGEDVTTSDILLERG